MLVAWSHNAISIDAYEQKGLILLCISNIHIYVVCTVYATKECKYYIWVKSGFRTNNKQLLVKYTKLPFDCALLLNFFVIKLACASYQTILVLLRIKKDFVFPLLACLVLEFVPNTKYLSMLAISLNIDMHTNICSKTNEFHRLIHMKTCFCFHIFIIDRACFGTSTAKCLCIVSYLNVCNVKYVRSM